MALMITDERAEALLYAIKCAHQIESSLLGINMSQMGQPNPEGFWVEKTGRLLTLADIAGELGGKYTHAENLERLAEEFEKMIGATQAEKAQRESDAFDQKILSSLQRLGIHK